MTPGLNTGLLASVSRSFYLSLRFLPGPVRAPLSLSYLLARAADTIADNPAHTPALDPARLLEEMHDLLATGDHSRMDAVQGFCEKAAAFAAGVTHEGERCLLQRMAECFTALAATPDPAAMLIRRVLDLIIRGQRLDLQRFTPGTLHALTTESELEEYTWLVAGCVGEFWTDICAVQLPGFSSLPVVEMRSLGLAYGKGLQLINILRDQPKDIAAGRCYLPLTALRAAGISGPDWPCPDWPAWHAVRRPWLILARQRMDAGMTYVRHLRSFRLRFAAVLPLLIGRATLDLLDAQPHDAPPATAKVTRPVIKRLMLRALKVSILGH